MNTKSILWRAHIALLAAALTLWLPAANARAAGDGDRWRVPKPEIVPARLPHLSQSLVLDGDLSEWQDAVCVPVRLRNDVRREIPPRKWRGPADAGMEVYCAWDSDGLCLAAVVTDDDVSNRFRGYQAFKQDSLHLLVDGRGPDRFLKPPASPGVYTILVTPPSAARRTRIHVDEPEGADISGLQVAGKRTPTGYQIEALIPWGGFPELSPKPGTAVGLQFGLHDYDRRDGSADYPLALSFGGASDLDESPQKYIKFVLVSQAAVGPEESLGPTARLDSPVLSTGRETLPVSLETGAGLSRRAISTTVRITDATGRTVQKRSVRLRPARPPWADSRRAEFALPAQVSTDGWYTIRATVADSEGRALGYVARAVLFVEQTLREAVARLRAADVARLSQTDPFKAAMYLGAAACLERLKCSARNGDAEAAASLARELTSRLELLETGEAASTSGTLCDLLLLASEPEAQAVVEFPWPRQGRITFYCGSLPLATVSVYEAETDELAAKAVAEAGSGFAMGPGDATTVGGRPARFVNRRHYQRFDIRDFLPEHHLVVGSFRLQDAVVIDVERIADARADAALIIEPCPPAVRTAVEAWAKERSVPVIGLNQASNQDRMLVAGSVRAPEAATVFADTLRMYTVTAEAEARYVVAAVGNRILTARSPAEAVTLRVAGLVLRGTPITPSDVDDVRLELVRALVPAESVQSKPDEIGLFCGDVHMHTFYSDGTPSPTGLMLQAMHCYMDFAVISDHNRIDGAMLAQRLLAEHGFAYPVIVGEEITNDAFHMNAYPLKRVVPPGRSPDETVNAAHAQGAVVQWNHPFSPDKGQWKEWADEHLANGIAGTGLDAWEHLPEKYEEWQAAGTLPLIVGSTDTHSGTFDDPERTIIWASGISGIDLAMAIRTRRAAAILPEPSFVYGAAEMSSQLWKALADGRGLKRATALRLKRALRNADLGGLLDASPAEPAE